MIEEGKTIFYDGMRVTREHLEHLQALLHQAVKELRATVGKGKIAFGFQVTKEAAQTIKVSPGLAYDKLGRRLLLNESYFADIVFNTEEDKKYIRLHHKILEDSLSSDEIPTLISDDVEIIVSSSPSDPESGDVEIASIIKTKKVDSIDINDLITGEKDDDNNNDYSFSIQQKGSSYLVPTNHRHSGNFFIDEDGFYRYDGSEIFNSRSSMSTEVSVIDFLQGWFDSGYISVGNKKEFTVFHNLGTKAIFVEIIHSSKTNPNPTNLGIGDQKNGYWYEIIDKNQIKVLHNIKESDQQDLKFRVLVRKSLASESATFIALTDIPGVGKKRAERLEGEGIDSVETFAHASPQKISKLLKITSESAIEEMQKWAKMAITKD